MKRKVLFPVGKGEEDTGESREEESKDKNRNEDEFGSIFREKGIYILGEWEWGGEELG